MYDMIPMEIAASGMSLQRSRMGVLASNLANAQSTRDADGEGPYQRRVLVARAASLPAFEDMLVQARRAEQGALQKGERSDWLVEEHTRGVELSRIERDPSTRMVYDPEHPDADPSTGMVTYPDISVVQEMTDMIAASHQYQANLAVLKNTRDMILQTVEIMRG